jgi:hypothetical protein
VGNRITESDLILYRFVFTANLLKAQGRLQKPPADERNCREKNSAENEVLIPSVCGSAQRQSFS